MNLLKAIFGGNTSQLEEEAYKLMEEALELISIEDGTGAALRIACEKLQKAEKIFKQLGVKSVK